MVPVPKGFGNEEWEKLKFGNNLLERMFETVAWATDRKERHHLCQCAVKTNLIECPIRCENFHLSNGLNCYLIEWVTSIVSVPGLMFVQFTIQEHLHRNLSLSISYHWNTEFCGIILREFFLTLSTSFLNRFCQTFILKDIMVTYSSEIQKVLIFLRLAATFRNRTLLVRPLFNYLSRIFRTF